MAVRNDPAGNYSRSPSKPWRFVQHLGASPLQPYCEIVDDFAPLQESDFHAAHEVKYVEDFFSGFDESNGLVWTEEFAETVKFTNGSLRAAVRAALADPRYVCLSPTSGFHHATPEGGMGFCTFSGQVLAALDVYRSSGAVGAWIDCDGHMGNSIEDSREFVGHELDAALPAEFHVNPTGRGTNYLKSLRRGLAEVGEGVLSGEVHYVCFAHGADSHEWDDMGGQCSTQEWIEVSRMVYSSVADWSKKLGRPVPLVLSLFGGYRNDHPASVLELHIADTQIALRELAGIQVEFYPKVERPKLQKWASRAV